MIPCVPDDFVCAGRLDIPTGPSQDVENRSTTSGDLSFSSSFHYGNFATEASAVYRQQTIGFSGVVHTEFVHGMSVVCFRGLNSEALVVSLLTITICGGLTCKKDLEALPDAC